MQKRREIWVLQGRLVRDMHPDEMPGLLQGVNVETIRDQSEVLRQFAASEFRIVANGVATPLEEMEGAPSITRDVVVVARLGEPPSPLIQARSDYVLINFMSPEDQMSGWESIETAAHEVDETDRDAEGDGRPGRASLEQDTCPIFGIVGITVPSYVPFTWTLQYSPGRTVSADHISQVIK